VNIDTLILRLSNIVLLTEYVNCRSQSTLFWCCKSISRVSFRRVHDVQRCRDQSTSKPFLINQLFMTMNYLCIIDFRNDTCKLSRGNRANTPIIDRKINRTDFMSFDSLFQSAKRTFEILSSSIVFYIVVE
jgi:hypothetical protein